MVIVFFWQFQPSLKLKFHGEFDGIKMKTENGTPQSHLREDEKKSKPKEQKMGGEISITTNTRLQRKIPQKSGNKTRNKMTLNALHSRKKNPKGWWWKGKRGHKVANYDKFRCECAGNARKAFQTVSTPEPLNVIISTRKTFTGI